MTLVKVDEFGSDSSKALNYTASEGNVHMAWNLPDGKVLSIEHLDEGCPAGSYRVYNSKLDYYRNIAGISWIKGAPSHPSSDIMYSSHGEWSTVHEIVQVERDERENATFDNTSPDLLEALGECPALWATPDPMVALRYAISASEWELSDDELKSRYPNYMDMIEEIHTDGYIVIAEDGDDGYLLVSPLKTEEARSKIILVETNRGTTEIASMPACLEVVRYSESEIMDMIFGKVLVKASDSVKDIMPNVLKIFSKVDLVPPQPEYDGMLAVQYLNRPDLLQNEREEPFYVRQVKLGERLYLYVFTHETLADDVVDVLEHLGKLS